MEAKMVVRKELVFLVVVLFLASFINADSFPLLLSENDAYYRSGDEILINAKVSNTFSYPVKARLKVSLVSEKENYPWAIVPIEFSLDGSKSKQVLVYDALVDENMANGMYKLIVDLSFNDNGISTKEVEFEVKGGLEEFNFDVKTCRSSSCLDETKIFIKGENVYLDYSSEIGEIDILASLTYPDGKFEDVDLPFSLKSRKKGTYVLEATASKQNYKDVTRKAQFSVIEEHAGVKSVSFCNSNGVCDGYEDYKSCPQDCSPGEESKERKSGTLKKIFGFFGKADLKNYKDDKLLFAFGGVVLLVVGVLFIYFRRREN